MSTAYDVYLDNNATTPVDPRVVEAMLPWLAEHHGNPSSIHRHGRRTREAVEKARAHVAAFLGGGESGSGEPVGVEEIVFTASGTEANNAVLAAVGRRWNHRGHLVISGLEHPSIVRAAERLAEAGMEVTRVPPGEDGVVSAAALADALRDDTRLACLMHANNEVGTLQPVEEAAALCRERGVPMLTDAVQTAGKVEVDVRRLGVDYLTIGAHKFHGPLGAAALWIRPGAHFEPLLIGGSQERRRRASTLNVPAIVGLGEACRLAREELAERRRHLAALRDGFEAGLDRIEDTVVHCRNSPRLPHTSHVAFPGLEAESLLIRLDMAGFAVSTGAACSSGVVEPSKTLTALGIGRDEALASLRISFGMLNRPEDVPPFLAALEENVAALRRLAPAGAPRTAAGAAAAGRATG